MTEIGDKSQQEGFGVSDVTPLPLLGSQKERAELCVQVGICVRTAHTVTTAQKQKHQENLL